MKKLYFLIFLSFIFFSSIAQNSEKGWKKLQKADTLKAIEIFEGVLEFSPQDNLANYAMALIYANQSKADYDIWSVYYHFSKIDESSLTNEKLIDINEFQVEKENAEKAVLENLKATKDLKRLQWFYKNYPDSRLILEVQSLEYEWEFEKANEENTVESYQNFLELYSKSPQAVLVQDKIYVLEFEKITQENTLEICENFIRNYPQAPQFEKVIFKRDSLAFEIAKEKDTEEAYQNFIKKYPNAQQVFQAKEFKEDLKVYTKEYLLGQIDPATSDLFVQIAPKYLLFNQVQYMRKEAYAAYSAMADAALKDGISLKIRSATRTFSVQKYIWENKWKTLGNISEEEKANIILQYSSMPGTSRHHWGTDVDINSLSPNYFTYGQGKKEYDWLVTNAEKYGFFQPYTAYSEARPTGYKEEKWHWSYRPIAEKCLRAYKTKVYYTDISGYTGSQVAQPLEVIKNYVQGIED